MSGLDWKRIEAGHYYAYGRRWDTHEAFHAHVQLIDGNWVLKINDVFRGYYGRARDAKARAAEVLTP